MASAAGVIYDLVRGRRFENFLVIKTTDFHLIIIIKPDLNWVSAGIIHFFRFLYVYYINIIISFSLFALEAAAV